jgi:imidazolonepropionase-like amidohydrolase
VPDGYPIAAANFDSLMVISPNDARKKIGRLIDKGADVIKITLESTVGPVLDPDTAAAIVETAHERGIPVTVHATQARDLKRALDAGVDDIAHSIEDHVSDELLQHMIDMDVSWVPTLEAQNGRGLDNLRRFVEAGGRVALGNDSGYIAGLELGMPLREIEWMSRAGMTPRQILIASTRDAAYVCGREGSLGTLEVGKIADVLVVAGDPLQDLQVLDEALVVVHLGTMIRGKHLGE